MGETTKKNKPGTLGQASNGIQEHYADKWTDRGMEQEYMQKVLLHLKHKTGFKCNTLHLTR